MEFPRKVLVLQTTTSKGNPNVIIPKNTVMDLTGRMGGTHVYFATHAGDNTFVLHVTMFKFLKDETDYNLYRRAVNRKGVSVAEEYYTGAYNAPIYWQLRRRDEELKFCMTSEDALEMAIFWETLIEQKDTAFSVSSMKRMVGEYVRYAEILETFERVIDSHYEDQLKQDKYKELNNAH